MRQPSRPVFIACTGVCVLIAITLFNLPTANASRSSVEYACTSLAPAGAFFAKSSRNMCEDNVGGAKSEIASDSKTEVVCFYQAQCTPITPDIRAVLTELAKSVTPPVKDWSELSGEQMTKMITLYTNEAAKQGKLPAMDFQIMQAQCVSPKTSSGNADCPGLQKCVNQRRNAALYWGVEQLPFKLDGARVRQRDTSAPSGVDQ
jgi:hypothetical protein